MNLEERSWIKTLTRNTGVSVFSRGDIENMPDRYRAQFISSLSGFKSANLIGTKSRDGQDNLAIVSSVVHIGAHPPLMMYISRPDSADRHTLANIRETGFYTFNHITPSFYQQAHQTSARYSKEQSEFTETQLESKTIEGFHAPFVAQAPLKIAMRLRQELPIEINGCVAIIGEVEFIEVDDLVISEDGHINVEALGSVCVSGLDSYHSTQILDRLSYAKPGRPPHSLLKVESDNSSNEKS